MTLLRRVARPLLAAVFVAEGLDLVRHPGPRVEGARPLVRLLAEPLRLPDDPELLVRANGAAMAAAGALLGIGRFPRLSALVLAASLVPTTYVEHPFWAEKDAEAKKRQRQAFLKNTALVGGLLIASVDTEGRPGLAWRSQRAAKDAKRAAGHAKRDARRATGIAKKDAKRAAKDARRGARLAAQKVELAVR
jgi:uncharacterized membrane protein YphA (DoxX/SURF4 family)